MADGVNSKKSLSMKTRLILIAIMFVIINLIFYFGFDSSDELGENKELDIDIMFSDEIQSHSQYDLLQITNQNLDIS
jgi:hypothetical protein|uniref:Uncharacterized protein n=1 Tax=uncultured marine thaumarchaeote KM3_41_H02 TaxID=1456146 RepID=A0A075H7Z4_9ARCH|nr:hypothetical protein [uncultured marine thaumarchaeote KM3_41_H02]